MDPIDLLVSEHRVIERVLDSLEGYAVMAARGGEVEHQRLTGYVTFIRGYADAIHHGKEEDVLFAYLRRKGTPAEFRPVIDAVRREHDTARLLTDDLASFLRRPAPWSAEARHEFRQVVAEYVSLLRQHITEEDRVVFRGVAEHLSGADMDEIAGLCERFELEHGAKRDALRALADRLSR